ncbi:germinal center-associated signaling and motility protein isoform X1 [Rousettus aegyptiacus]|uniref:germinal center-associated signaling and motility protein isoform X1 n=1 Tax=Rousettus aegyptiacus TaxID=9407 RepID=UPI0007889FA9|nr:germinal center-associated signaling and motility protein isoform X1 [Rousettus aegyptiacus]
MANSLLRENRWQQNTQEISWNLKNQNFRRRTSRWWDCHIAEGCFCLPWKKIHNFKTKQDSPKENKGTSSATNQQDNVDQNSAEELCYTLINHNILMRRPSETSAEGHYENVPHQAERPRKLLERTETEYSLVHVPSTPRHPPSPEDAYEFLMPRRNSSHTLQPPHLLMLPSEAHIFHL